MTQIPAGWYPDPDPNQTAPGAQRYWDGQQWTEHVHAPGASQPPPGPAPYAAQPQGPGQGVPGYGAMSGYGQMPGTYAATRQRATTPDGQALAGWWHRVGAYLIDVVILIPITLVVALPWVRELVEVYRDAFSGLTAADGTAAIDQAQLAADVAGPTLALSVISLLLGFFYHAGFLKWKAATPGKLLTGLRVRLRETPGPLAWGTVLLRWLGQFGYVLLGFIPFLGGVLPLFYLLLDSLWPLWDPKKQAIHDKIARTNVVRVRG